MSVYVDKLQVWGGADAPKCFRFKPSCHMYADTLDELHAMAKRIGMFRSWFQDKEELPHYDLTENKRRQALMYGAISTDAKHMVEYMRKNRDGSS